MSRRFCSECNYESWRTFLACPRCGSTHDKTEHQDQLNAAKTPTIEEQHTTTVDGNPNSERSRRELRLFLLCLLAGLMCACLSALFGSLNVNLYVGLVLTPYFSLSILRIASSVSQTLNWTLQANSLTRQSLLWGKAVLVAAALVAAIGLLLMGVGLCLRACQY